MSRTGTITSDDLRQHTDLIPADGTNAPLIILSRDERGAIELSSLAPVPVPAPRYASYEAFKNEVLAHASRSGWRGTGQRLTKSFKLKFNRVSVRGRAVVDFGQQTRRVWSALEWSNSSMLNNAVLLWNGTGTVRHPHEVRVDPNESPYLCHTLDFKLKELVRLRDQGELPGWLVGVVEGAYYEFNPGNLGNSAWGECPACHVVTHLATHRCAQAGRLIGPTLAKFEVAVMIGCGVTGSWMLPVLSRVSRMVMVFDRDTVSRLNPNGRWSGLLTARTRKTTAAIEPRYSETTVAIHRTFDRHTRLPHVDLVVMAPDRAAARRNTIRNPCISAEAWIVDMRVAGDQLVIWTFKRGSDMYATWLDDITSYVAREAEPQPCGRFHDNIPLVAGTVAASFLSWWTTREPEEGIWNPQLSQPWENMAATQQDDEEDAPAGTPTHLSSSLDTEREPEDVAATEADIEAQRVWDEDHAVPDEEGDADAQPQEGAVLVQPESETRD